MRDKNLNLLKLFATATLTYSGVILGVHAPAIALIPSGLASATPEISDTALAEFSPAESFSLIDANLLQAPSSEALLTPGIQTPVDQVVTPFTVASEVVPIFSEALPLAAGSTLQTIEAPDFEAPNFGAEVIEVATTALASDLLSNLEVEVSYVESDAAPAEEDWQMEQLKADISKLQTQYSASGVTDEAVTVAIAPGAVSQPTPITTPMPTENPAPRPQTVATSSMTSSSNPFLASLTSLEPTMAPELPALASANIYLPAANSSSSANTSTFTDGYIWPAKGVLTSGFGWRWGRMHSGIDIGAPVGTPVFAVASGVVISSGWSDGGYGNLVELQHPGGSVTLYAHNHRLLVKKGELVQQGQQIAEVGSTGRSTGPHLHFELHPPGKPAVNPLAYLPR